MVEMEGENLPRKTLGEKAKKLPIFALFGLVLFFLAAGILSQKTLAANAPTIITYQGKLLVDNRLATTTQSVYFLLYDAANAGSILYTASGTVGTPDAVSITPTQGLFSINLGDTGTNTLSPAIFQNNGSVYLEVRIGADTLTPRKRITAAPYAFNAKYLDGVGINTLSSTTYIPISDASGNFVFNSTTIRTSTISNLIAGFTTTTALYVSNTTSFAGLLTFTTASGTAITSTNAYIANLVVDNCIGCGVGGGGSGTIGTSTANYFSFYTAANSVTGTSFVQFANGAFTIATDTILATTTVNGPFTFTVASGTAITSTNLVVTGGLSLPNGSITDAMVDNGITASNYLPLAGGTLTGPLFFSSVSGTSITSTNAIFVGVSSTNLYISGSVSLPNDSITNSMVVNALTINGGAIDNTPIGATTPSTGVFTSATSTNLFATSSVFVGVTSTNLYISGSVALPNNSITDAMVDNGITASNYLLLTGGTLTGGLVFTTASGTMITSTNAIFTNVTTTNLYVSGVSNFGSINLTDLTFTNASGTRITSTNAVITNKLGVGTSTPAEALSVVGNISNIIDANSPISEITTTIVDSGPYSIFVSGRYAYTANRTADNISIIDISNPSAPVQISTTSVGSSPYSIFVSGRYAYVVNRSSATVSVVDISNPSAPLQISTVSVESGPQSIFVSGRYAYVANSQDDSISVLDISNPFVPIQIATTSVELTPKSIFVSGRYAYTANNGGSISIIDISNPSNPFQTATTSAGDPSQQLGPNSISVFGRYAYTVNSNDTFSVFDVKNPNAPIEVASTTVDAGSQWLYISGRYAYVVATGGTVSVVDISNPLIPKQIKSVSVPGGPLSIFVSGRYAYTTNLDDTISVIDISGTEVTSLIAHSAEVGQFQVRNDIFAQGNIMAGTSLMVGAGGIYSQGGLSVFASSTGATSSIFNVGSAVATGTLRVFADGTIVLATTTVSGPLNFTNASGISVTSTNLYISGNSNFAGGIIFVSASGTSITSTNAFFGTVSSTNFFVSAATSSYLSILGNANFAGALTFNTVSGTSITSTNAFFGRASSTALTSTNAFFNIVSSTNFFVSAATSSYLSILGNANFAGALTFNTVSGTSITSTNAFFTNLSATNFNPTNITAVSITSTNLFATSSVFNTTTINNRLGIGTTTPNEKLTVVGNANVIGNISNFIDSSTVSFVATSTVTGGLVEMFATNNFLYTVGNSSPYRLSIFDISNGTPVFIASTTLDGTPSDVVVAGRYAYVSVTTPNSLAVIDISTPSSPRQVASTSAVAGPLFVSGKYVYVVNGTVSQLRVIDVSNPLAPRQVAQISTGGSTPTRVFVQGPYAYITHRNNQKLSIFNVSDPANPVQVSATDISAAESLYVSGNYAYVASNTLAIVDISNPSVPVIVGTTTSAGNSYDIKVSGRYAFAADRGSNNMSVFDVASSTAPTLVGSFSTRGTGPWTIENSGKNVYVYNNQGTAVLSAFSFNTTEVASLLAHAAEVGNLNIRNNIYAQGLVVAGTGLTVGAGGIFSQGGLSVFASSTGSTSTLFLVGSPSATNTLQVFANGTIQITTTTATGLFTFASATGTSLTSTNAFHDFSSSTRLFAGAVTSSYLYISGNTTFAGALNFNTASGTAITSTFAFHDFSSSTRLFAGAATSSFLSILGNANFAGALTFNTASGTSLTSTNAFHDFSSSTRLFAGAATSSFLSILGNANFAGALTFNTASGTMITTTNLYVSNKVGIGTSTPTEKLSVVGNISNVIDANTAISQVGSIATIGQPNVMVVSGRYGYVAGFTDNKLSVVDLSTPGSPAVVGSVSLGFGPSNVFVSGRYAYVIDAFTGVLGIVDVSNPGAPTQVSTTTLQSYTAAIYVSGRYLYAAQDSSKDQVEVLDISNPLSPVSVATTSVGASPTDIYVLGRYAYVANSASNTMSVVDISNPGRPTQVATTSVGNLPRAIFVSGRYAYVANQDSNSVSIVDISKSSTPTVVATVSVGLGARSVFISGRYLFTANRGDNTVSVVDVSVPSSPVVLKTLTVGSDPRHIFVSGRYAYVTNVLSETISILDISGAEVAALLAHSAEVGQLQSRSDIFAQGNIMAGTSLAVGAGGIYSQGALTVFASSTGSTSSIFRVASAQVANIFNAFANGSVSIGTSTASSTMTIQGTVGTNPLSINSSTGASLFTILQNGNVGIGTSTQQSKLTVVGTAGGNAIFELVSSSNATLFKVLANGNIGINSSSPVATLAITGNDGMNPFTIVSSTGLSIFTILANGSVGINTSSPSSIFSVVGTSTFSGNVLPNSSPTPGGSSQVTTTVDSIGGTGQYTSIAIGTDGLPVVSYYNVSSTDLMVAKCGNASCSSGNVTTTIDSGNNRGQYTSVAIGTDGLPVISYYDVTNADLMVAKCGNASCSSGNVTTTVDSIGNTGQYTSIAIGTDGLPVISYYNVSSTALMVAKCGNASCSSGNVTTTVETFNGQYTSIAIGTDGLPVISYYDVVRQDLAVAKCGNISCSSGNVTTTVDASGVNQYTSIAIGTDGLPVISYYDGSSGNLKVAKCGSTSCASDNVARNVTTSLGTISVNGGQDTSIAIGTDGLPVISAYDSFNGDLLVYKCGNVSCTSSSTATRFDTGGDRGGYSSIAIGTDGLPVISYFNNNSGDLMVAKCADPACKNRTGGSYSGGYDIGSLGSFFNNVYANSFWGKQFQIEGFDLAESYRVDDYTISAGDLVRIATSSSGVRPIIERTDKAYDGVIGVISTNPGVRLSDWTSSEDGRLVALVGRVPTKVSTENGPIMAGDLIAASSLPGVGMKATREGAIVGRALEPFIGGGVGTIEVYVNPSWAPGQSPLAIDATSKTITMGSSSDPYDLVVSGNIILNQNNLINKLSFATSSLFESAVGNFSGARAFTFNVADFTNPSPENYILSLRANNSSVFSVASNGDVHALGNYYGASAVLGTSTNPGDLAERVDIAIDDTAEPGDVMIVDPNAPDTYRRSGSAYEQSVAGVISTNPTIVVGNGRTAYTAVLAMVGRVPIKASDENGAITRGDLLVSASRAGYAMKYDPAKDKNNSVVGIIGMALEPLPPSSSGKILALIRTGWVYNRDEDIKKLKNNIEQVAVSQGINLNTDAIPQNLNLENNNNQLVYVGGSLNLQNNSLINVAAIIGNNNKWRIDEFGNLVQKIATAAGDKEIYGLQSTMKQEIVISGTSTLENGSKRVMLTDLDQAIIDRTVPLKIMITPSGETFGVYVAERSYDSFLVKENGNGMSNAEFDWTVIAKVLSPEEAAASVNVESSSTIQMPLLGGGEQSTNAPTSSPPVSSSASPTIESPVSLPTDSVTQPNDPTPASEPATPSSDPTPAPEPVAPPSPEIVPAAPAP